MRHEDNELLVRTKAGTPMGEVFRRFWIPALLARELPGPDCDPVKVRVLGEDLVAFRDTEGRVGVMDAYCPHRGAPLHFGRNEDGGLRCIYHGWKFDVAGRCLEMPNVTHGDTAREKMCAVAYKAVEGAGMVWVYMGPPDDEPPLPGFEFLGLGAGDVYVDKYQIDCNWLQAVESDFDISHALFLHSTMNPGRSAAEQMASIVLHPDADLPRYVTCEDTAYGVRASYCHATGTGRALRLTNFVLPSFSTGGLAEVGQTFGGNLRVPIDDEHTWWFRLRWSPWGISDDARAAFERDGFVFAPHEPGSWRPLMNRDNDYLQSRALQRQFNFTGVTAFMIQDLMVAESQWGPIADRTREHLVASDRHIVAIRRRLRALAAGMADGVTPAEPASPDEFKVRSARVDIPTETEIDPWLLGKLVELSRATGTDASEVDVSELTR